MNKEEWASLVSCTGWAPLKQYLMEYRQALMEKMAEGSAPHPETIYRCQSLKDLASLEYADIAKFYGLEPDNG